jgi:hypothetical protein
MHAVWSGDVRSLQVLLGAGCQLNAQATQDCLEVGAAAAAGARRPGLPLPCWHSPLLLPPC